VKNTPHRRKTVLLIGSALIVTLVLIAPSIFMVFQRPPEVIYSSPGYSITLGNGEWFANSFIIDDARKDCGVGVDGVLFNHNNNVENFVLEFGFAPLSLTDFQALNDTEKRDSFWGFSSGSGLIQSGSEYSIKYPNVGPLGEYIWAIRFIDYDNNLTVFETDFVVSLS
jgi:hypothetical protein